MRYAQKASDLGRGLSVSRQAAAKTITALERLGYVERKPDPGDARVKRLQVTERGHEMMTLGASLFDEVRERWASQLGIRQLEALEAHLAQVGAKRPVRSDGHLADHITPARSAAMPPAIDPARQKRIGARP